MAFSLSGMERQALAIIAVSIALMAVGHEVMQLKEIGGAMHSQFFEGAEDYYAVLGLKETSTPQEIETAYKRKTSQFHSRNKDEEERRTRAKIVTAHEALSNGETRKAYDSRRRLVHYLGLGVQGLLISIPLIGMVLLNWRLLKFLSSSAMPAALGSYFGISWAFEGRLRRILKRIEVSVEVSLSRDSSSERLGMELLPPRTLPSGGIGIEVGSIQEGGVVEGCNQALRAARLGEAVAEPLPWWSCPELHAGDVITSVNGSTRPDQLMEEMKTSESLCLTVRRSLQTLLPWLVELELSREVATERWGCQLSAASDGSDTLEVSSDEFAGALQRWNEAHPALCVRKGDRIVAVNRELKVDKMSTHMRDPVALVAKWLIVRGVFPSDPAPLEVACGPFRKQSHNDKLGIRIGPALDSPVHGHMVEAGSLEDVTVVKEVRAGYLVDKWNESARGPKVEVGAAVLSVNGRTNPKDFAAELSKHIVNLRLRPARGSKVVPMEVSEESMAVGSGGQDHSRLATNGQAGGTAAEARLLPLRLDVEETPPLILRLLGRFLPSFLGPKSFEVRLRSSLAALRCEFDVEITRREGGKLGLNLQPARDEVGGLAISEVTEGSLLGEYNSRATGRTALVKVGDRLVMVNGHAMGPPMIEELSNQTVEKLNLRFSRRAAEAAPGVWEAEVERYENEGWGMELREQLLTGGKPGSGVLRIEGIHPGSAVDRWNTTGSGSGSKWVVEPGDLIVAAAPEVGHDRTVAKLKASHRVRLTLLRWHAGPAPGAVVDDPTTLRFQVTLLRASPSDKLGVRLNPSDWDPTRTVVDEIIPGGLVERHNEASSSSGKGQEVKKGDEVESINGETDHSKFAKCCQASQLVLCLGRRGGKDANGEDLAQGGNATPTETTVASAPASPSAASVASRVRQIEAQAPSPSSATSANAPVPASPPAATPPTVTAPPVALPPVATRPQPVAAAPERTPSPPLAAVMPTIPAAASAPASLPISRLVALPAATEATEGAGGGMSPQRARSETDQKAARENMLLKAEMEQLRQERNKLLMDSERLKGQNAALWGESERVERREKELRSPERLEKARRGSDAEDEVAAMRLARAADQHELIELRAREEAVRLEREAEQRQLRAQEERLQAARRLETENSRLTAQVAQLLAKLGNAHGHGATAVLEREVVPLELAAPHSVRQQLPPAALEALGGGLARLQELSASLDEVLAANPDLSSSLPAGSRQCHF